MDLKPEKYVRKPFPVEAVEVTFDNMREVAQWCGGRVKTDRMQWSNRIGQKYVQVHVPRALNERQTMAYVGDWVLYSGSGPNGFKVYTPKAFESSFVKEAERMLEVVERMEARAEDEDADEEADEVVPVR
jgi:hypothetical protein